MILVERANERIKNYDYLKLYTSTVHAFIKKIFHVCRCLVNLQASLLKEIVAKYE